MLHAVMPCMVVGAVHLPHTGHELSQQAGGALEVVSHMCGDQLRGLLEALSERLEAAQQVGCCNVLAMHSLLRLQCVHSVQACREPALASHCLAAPVDYG
jgi:hypothetical protein